MKKLVTVLMILCMGTLVAAGALAADVEVQKETAVVMDDYGSKEYRYVALVKNVTDEDVLIRDAALVLKDSAGEEIAKAEYCSELGSAYLEPEEVTAIMFKVRLDDVDPSKIAEKKLVFNTEKNASYGIDKTFEVASAEYIKDTSGSKYEDDKMTIVITNNGQEAAKNLGVVFVLVDAEGNPLHVRTSDLYNVSLLPGGSLLFEERADRETVDFYTENGMAPVKVEAYAFTKEER